MSQPYHFKKTFADTLVFSQKFYYINNVMLYNNIFSKCDEKLKWHKLR